VAKQKIVHESSCGEMRVVTFDDGEMMVGGPRGPSVGVAPELMKKGFKTTSRMPLHFLFSLKESPCPDCWLINMVRCEAVRPRVIVEGRLGYELEYWDQQRLN
jgi:hypothetical protein